MCKTLQIYRISTNNLKPLPFLDRTRYFIKAQIKTQLRNSCHLTPSPKLFSQYTQFIARKKSCKKRENYLPLTAVELTLADFLELWPTQLLLLPTKELEP